MNILPPVSVRNVYNKTCDWSILLDLCVTFHWRPGEGSLSLGLPGLVWLGRAERAKKIEHVK